MTQEELYARPIPLESTRVRRTYMGGSWLDSWSVRAEAFDTNRPEEWLASMTEARNPGFPPIENEGLTCTVIGKERRLLRELVEADPEAMLGRSHLEHYGTNPGVLAKIIDSAERLSVQVHPDKKFAKERFHSDYGKNECWHILGTRTVNGQDPFLLIGFKPGVTREKWERVYKEQDIPAMIDCLNRVKPQAGETWLIRGGLPHAIGPGCILIEIQEPTDYTLRSERTMADGTPIPELLIHQGLGEAALMDCFHYDTISADELKSSCGIEPEVKYYPDGSSYELLVGPRDTSCFAMEKLEIQNFLELNNTGSFSSLVTLEGSGKIEWETGELPLDTARQVFLPAALKSFTLRNCSLKPLRLIRCHPPGVDPVSPAYY